MTNSCVYIIANKKNGVLYIGLTKKLKTRIRQHITKAHPNTFSARYDLNKFVYFEKYEEEEVTKEREKRMKKWRRNWKSELIENKNPNWDDLYNELK
ncbi:MAG: putative endonuclease [Flavobacteriaceae bacterium]|jgi:putative endonuclease|uniref:GIY-YIG nuclease family protein n=1 Tax=Candidatus Marifrigoribacter sp. Uisw_064 TaxID=3230970 RepID=UPI003ADFFD44